MIKNKLRIYFILIFLSFMKNYRNIELSDYWVVGLSIRTRLFWVIAAVTSFRWSISPLTITNSRKSANEPQYDLTVPGLNFYKILVPWKGWKLNTRAHKVLRRLYVIPPCRHNPPMRSNPPVQLSYCFEERNKPIRWNDQQNMIEYLQRGRRFYTLRCSRRFLL